MRPYSKTLLSSSLTLILFLSLGCTQRNGRLQRPIDPDLQNSRTLLRSQQNGRLQRPINPDLQNSRTLLRSQGFLDTIEQQARMVSHEDYLYAFGTGAGFGVYNIKSNEFVDRRDLLDSSQGGFNVAEQGFSTITAMVYIKSNHPAHDSIVVSTAQGLFQMFHNAPVSRGIDGNFIKRFKKFGDGFSYSWNSAVHIPGTNLVFGFKDTKMFRLDLSRPDLAPLERDVLVSGAPFNLSCGRGAAFYKNRIYVAGCTKLLEITLSGGNYRFEALDLGINPNNVVATQNFLYVQNKPSGGSSLSAYSPGIYVFNRDIQKFEDAYPVTEIFLSDSRYAERSAFSFAVSNDDDLLFANIDNKKINVFEIP
jgi:hypothetical protein